MLSELGTIKQLHMQKSTIAKVGGNTLPGQQGGPGLITTGVIVKEKEIQVVLLIIPK